MTVRNKSGIGKGMKRGVKMIHAPILMTFPDIFYAFYRKVKYALTHCRAT